MIDSELRRENGSDHIPSFLLPAVASGAVKQELCLFRSGICVCFAGLHFCRSVPSIGKPKPIDVSALFPSATDIPDATTKTERSDSLCSDICGFKIHSDNFFV